MLSRRFFFKALEGEERGPCTGYTPSRLVDDNTAIMVHLALNDTNSGEARCLTHVGTEGMRQEFTRAAQLLAIFDTRGV
jgi:hypothetical protein